MHIDVSVIIVTYNARDLIDRCITAVEAQVESGVSIECIVVDNDSTDDTAQHVRDTFPSVRVIESGRNGGMAAGNNLGMLAARGSSFLLLNSDAFMADGALRAMLDRLAAEGDPVAAVAPQLRNVDGSLQRSIRGFPTAWRYATEFWYLRRLAPRARWANAMYGAGIDPDQPSRIEWATGACLLVPRASVDAVGLMDEGYFMYGEEVDWLHRMRESGRSVAYEPAAQVVHVGGGSARKEWGRMYEQQLVNHVRYMQRCEGQSAARRTKRVIVSGLRMRSIVWRALQRERTDAFASGARAVKRIDLAIDPVAQVPAWSPATNPPAASIDR